MASCENCHTTGIKAEDMRVVEEFDGGPKYLIGPCCIGAPVQFGRPPQVNYHFEVSSEHGIVATVEYGGLRLEYRKSQEQLRQKFMKQEPEVPVEVH